MTQGDPGFDVWGMDVARYGDWATMAYTNVKVRENYSSPLPHPLSRTRNCRPRRPLRTTPDLRQARKPNMRSSGEYCGLEHRALVRALERDLATEEQITFHRSGLARSMSRPK